MTRRGQGAAPASQATLGGGRCLSRATRGERALDLASQGVEGTERVKRGSREDLENIQKLRRHPNKFNS